MMPGSLSIETSVCSSPLDAAAPAADNHIDIPKGLDAVTIPTIEDTQTMELAPSLQKAIQAAVSSLEEDELSSTDTAVSSPIFDSCSAKGSSDGSVTEEEREVTGLSKVVSTISPAIDDAQVKEEEVQPAIPSRPLATKRSLWNLIRGASMSVATTATTAIATPILQVPDVVPIEATKPEDTVEVVAPQQIGEGSGPSLSKRKSFATFPNLNWSKSSRRHTLTATDGSHSIETSVIGIERSLDGSIHLPKRNVDEAKVAEDAMRFADARHLIKTEQNIEVIRHLADRLEQGWREKQLELAMMRHKLEESQLHLHDIRDENKHLRSQLASMSEQIVARDVDFEELQKMAVEQSKKERAIWEIEKSQAVHEVEEKIKELQEELSKMKRRQIHSLVDESDEESDYRDAVLFSATTSATTSVDDEMQYQQSNLAVPSTTPTTPTSHAANAWHSHFSTLRADPLAERLATLQVRQLVV